MPSFATLKRELSPLQSILDQLGSDTAAVDAPRKRGRKSAADKAAAAEAELAKAVELIQASGKGGIKAIKLSHEMRKAGHGKVNKIDLLGTEKIRMTGKGGASTYVFHG